MKKVCAYLSIMFFLLTFVSNGAFAQKADAATETATETEATATVTEQTQTESEATAEVAESKSFHQVLKTKYIEGGVGWMTPILICLILGLTPLAIVYAIAIYIISGQVDKNKEG